MIEGVRGRMRGAQVVQARYEPVVGACIMGLDKLGMEPSKWEVGIQKSAAVLGLLRS